MKQNNIRSARKAANMTMKELGARIGLAESTISQYETGKRDPDNTTLLMIAEEFLNDFVILWIPFVFHGLVFSEITTTKQTEV